MSKIVIITVIIAVAVLGWFGWNLLSPLLVSNVVNETIYEVYPSSKTADNPGGDIMELEGKVLYSGIFVDADSFHKTSGNVKIIGLDGDRYLRLEDFKTTNGPDLKVYLSKDLDAGEFISLGDLKGNIGNQNYEINEEINFEEYDNVLIWCEDFSVLFGSAEIN